MDHRFPKMNCPRAFIDLAKKMQETFLYIHKNSTAHQVKDLPEIPCVLFEIDFLRLEEVVCNTGTLCNDKDASGFFPKSFAHRSQLRIYRPLKFFINSIIKRSAEIFLEEEPFMETFDDDDKTTTKAPTTTTPTTTVAPDFQCYMCMANANGNITGEYKIATRTVVRISRHEF